jgi:hypothetical protein
MSLFGIPPDVEPALPQVDLSVVQDANFTVESIRRLAASKPFMMWFLPRLQKRVDDLAKEILEGDLEASEIMNRRIQRKEVMGILTLLKSDYGTAARVIDQWRSQEARSKQVKAPIPVQEQVASPFSSPTEPVPAVSVNSLVTEFTSMFSPFDQPAEPPASETQTIQT